MLRKLFLMCVLVSVPAFADEPRAPLNIDPTQLTNENVPIHMRAKGAVFVEGRPDRAIVVKKLYIKEQSQPDSRTVVLKVDLEATECGKPFSGPATVTYCLSNHDRWSVCKIDCTATKYYERKK